MRVLIFGINHQIQWVRIWSYSSGGELERFEAGHTVPGLYRYACPPNENDAMVGEVTVTK